MEILVIGGGGREHAIIKKLSESKKVAKLYALPGNAGISALAECRPDIKATDFPRILEFIKERPSIDYTVVAPDDPLALGLVNEIRAMGKRAFGPVREAAVIEASKVFSKNLMKKYGIPTAAYEVFTDESAALNYLKACKYPAVVKADGLALGKGVIICFSPEEGQAAAREMFAGKFGSAGSEIVVEEFLTGFEVSVLAFTDGECIVPMLSSQDHKRALDGDKGLNTGGMGTYAPCAKYTAELAQKAMETVFLPTIRAMKAENREFSGVIYFGLMIDGDDIKVLEYNARFGDPETQVILPLLKTDLSDIFEAVMDKRLKSINIEWEDGAAVCVIAASGGYPLEYRKNLPIKIGGLPGGAYAYHAGTAFNAAGELVTAGGRVLGITAKGKNVAEARASAYKAIEEVSFEGMHYRTDIAAKA